MKTRRDFLKQAAMFIVCVGSVRLCPAMVFAAEKSEKMKLGLVTYQ